MHPALGTKRVPDSSSIFEMLPGRPREINTVGEVLVVCGDVWTMKTLPDSIPTLDSTNSKQLKDTLRRKTLLKYLKDTYIPIVDSGFVAVVGSIWMSVLAFKHKDQKTAGRQISRRQFLKMIGAVAASVGLITIGLGGRLFITEASAKTKTTEKKDFFVHLSELIGPRIAKRETADFRTALLYLKTQDAIDRSSFGTSVPASMIMGAGHNFKVREIMQQKDKCQKIVKDYGDYLNSLLEEVHNKYPDDFDIDYAKQILRLDLALTEVVSVTDPGDPPYPSGLQKAMRQSITAQDEFYSERVLQALG